MRTEGEEHTAKSGLRRYRFGILLAALLCMLVCAPLLELVTPQLPPIATRLSLGIILAWLTISAVYAVSTRRRTPVVAAGLGVLLVVAECGDLSLLRTETHIASQSLGILFLGNIVIALLGFVFRQKRIDTNTVFAALCVYLLMGIVWAFAYSLLERVQPGAFSCPQTGQQMRFGSEDDLAVYFSFVTLTTLGYGDVAPVSAASRALAMLEAIFGQLYLTVLIAWLVGLHIAHMRPNAPHADS